jgi:serine/threonine protein kinase
MGRNGQSDPPRLGGRYRLIERLGTGGMSVVWRGYDEILGRSVAVKVLSPRLADDQSFRDRLRQEALAAARLCHPHITGIFDFGEAPHDERVTVPYVVMELNDGESVSARIARRGPLPWREAVTIAAEVASALATAHARGVVHRDVTPANVMLTGSGAKVVDFGISAIVGQRDAAPDGSLLGTPAYLAPERLGGSQVSTATDVYALGLLLYRALAGRLPWPAETTADALRAHLYADPEPLPPLAGLPTAVRDLCLRCLAKSPADRPGAAEVARALAAEVGLQPIIPPLSARESSSAAVSSAVPVAAGVSSVAATGSLPPSSLPAPPSSSPSSSLPSAASPVPFPSARGSASPGAQPSSESWPALGRALLAYLGLPGGVPASRPSFGLLRLRAGLKIGSTLRIGVVRPLGGGLFAGGGLARDLLAGRGLPPVLSGRYRIQAALITVALLGTAGVSWSATRDTPDVQPARAAGAVAAATPADPVCAVRYQLRRDSGSDYEAVLTVATTAEVATTPWRVQFSYPGSQRLTGIPKAVTQKGRKVVAKGRGKLQTFTLRGAYNGYNALPLSFTVDGHRCRVEILGGLTKASSEDQPTGSAGERPARGDGVGQPRRPRPRTPQRGADHRTPPSSGPTGDGFSLAL